MDDVLEERTTLLGNLDRQDVLARSRDAHPCMGTPRGRHPDPVLASRGLRHRIVGVGVRSKNFSQSARPPPMLDAPVRRLGTEVQVFHEAD